MNVTIKIQDVHTAVIAYVPAKERMRRRLTDGFGEFIFRHTSDQLPRKARPVANVTIDGEVTLIDGSTPVSENVIAAAREWLAVARDGITPEALRSAVDALQVLAATSDDDDAPELDNVRSAMLKANAPVLVRIADEFTVDSPGTAGLVARYRASSDNDEQIGLLSQMQPWGRTLILRTATAQGTARKVIEQLNRMW